MTGSKQETHEAQQEIHEMQRKTNEIQSKTNRTQIGTALILLVAGLVFGLIAANIL